LRPVAQLGPIGALVSIELPTPSREYLFNCILSHPPKVPLQWQQICVRAATQLVATVSM